MDTIKAIKLNGIYICPICNREFNNHQSYNGHISASHKRKNFKRGGGWNRGLTKHTDPRVRKGAETLKFKYSSGEIIRHKTVHTEESKRKISIGMLGNKNFKYNPESKTGKGIGGYYKGIYCASRYELVYLIYCIDHDIPIRRNSRGFKYTYNNKVHKYYPDFIINDNLLIEIKGYHTDLVDIKLKSVTEDIKILYYNDLLPYFEYVYNKYNVKYHELQNLYDN